MQPPHYYVLFFCFFSLTSEGLQRERDVFIQTVAGASQRVKRHVRPTPATSSLLRRNGIGNKFGFFFSNFLPHRL